MKVGLHLSSATEAISPKTRGDMQTVDILRNEVMAQVSGMYTN